MERSGEKVIFSNITKVAPFLICLFTQKPGTCHLLYPEGFFAGKSAKQQLQIADGRNAFYKC